MTAAPKESSRELPSYLTYLELPFESGASKGLRTFSKARQMMADAKARGRQFETIACGTTHHLSLRQYEQHAYDTYINPKTRILTAASTAAAAAAYDELEDSVESLEDSATIGTLLAQHSSRLDPVGPPAALSIEDIPIAMEAVLYRKYPLHRFKQLLFSGGLSDKELLITAYKQRHFRFLDLLTDRSWNLNQHVDSRRRTLLHYACRDGELDKASYLLEHGARPSVLDARGITPLHLALGRLPAFNSPQVIHLLCDHGADVDIADDRGMTPLHRACLLRQPAYVEALVRRRADVYRLDRSQKLPIQHAGEITSNVLAAYKANVAACGRDRHTRMWAHLMSRDLVAAIFSVTQSSCPSCKRKNAYCAALKKKDFRFWLFVHGRTDAKLI